MPTLGETSLYPVQATAPYRVMGKVTVVIGAAGAVASVTGMPGVTVARTGAGAYSVAFNRAADVVLEYGVQLSAAIYHAVGTARNSVAGTAAFKTCVASGTNTDPAANDEITIGFYGRVNGAV